ncbi:rhodanese-like domain-containing protein [Mucilaginibacter hurinus]|uniref:Rhodanese-like domain-containing protein n=1 Tax=Mucilaginibacter hurinus TaxID=2201324 RepID=A0A367GQN6_9SPHI|nr:rhodanese-like domain-containing protein [Mucilaginibacter hurinus]RCH55784.1 rhodanese-like domain-containing protein [Mucilaginibacter hurinus]
MDCTTVISALSAGFQLSGSTAKLPVIFNIGVVEDIKGAIHIGAASEAGNLRKLRVAVKPLPKNTPIVIYCGCCPFAKCPNAKPAFSELKALGYTQVKMLNLPTNLNTDWTAKGYPLKAK